MRKWEDALSSLDWPILMLSIITLLLFVFSIRNHVLIQSLSLEKKRDRDQVLMHGKGFSEAKGNLNRMKLNVEQSTNEVESLNQQISHLLDKNNKDNLESVEEQYQTRLELIESQKTLIYRAITSSGADEANAMVITDLVNFVEEVSSKSKVIHDIAFKTKVLSFNASVEAERAGARGRGFSIVAQEMKRLAEISGKAAEEIASLVDRTRRGSLMLTSQQTSTNQENSMQNTLMEAGGNLEKIQAKVNEFNSSFGSMVNQQGEAQSHLEKAFIVVNQLSRAQSEIQALNENVIHIHDSIAS